MSEEKVALETKKPKSWCKSISAFEKDNDKTFVIVEVMKG